VSQQRRLRPSIYILVIVFIHLSIGVNPALGDTGSRESGDIQQLEDLQKNAKTAFALGQFATSAHLWKKLADLYGESGLYAQQSQSLIYLSEACHATGNTKKALSFLEKALSLAQEINDLELIVKIQAAFGKNYYQTGDLDHSRYWFEKCLVQINSIDQEKETATILLNYSNLLFALHDIHQSRQYCMESLELAEKNNAWPLAVKAEINLTRIELEQENVSDIHRRLKSTMSRTMTLSDNHDKAFSLVSIGRLAIRCQQENVPQPEDNFLLLLAHDALSTACRIAETIDDTRTLSYGLGYLGLLYEENRQFTEAASLTQQAIFFSRKIESIDSLYQWQWQKGRIFNALGELDKAIDAYKHAIESIAQIREDLVNDCKRKSRLSYRESIGPVYFELADLLLKRCAVQKDPGAKQKDLITARSTVELMKRAELQEYFQDPCVTAFQARISGLDSDIPGAAVIYPVLLPDRLELIVTIEGSLTNYPVDVDLEMLTGEVKLLRKKLQQPGTRYLRSARRLYNWLISPIEKDLETSRISTLVFVPDGPLRTIPMSTLHDGNQFLIEKFALATTPGLTITDLVPFRRQGSQVLLSGLTKGVQGFPPLPGAALELDELDTMFDSTLLKDNNFHNSTVETALKNTPFSVVHIASHGQFDRDPDKTFLLTHDNRLTLDILEELMGLSRFRTEPVELLTLSACQTAIGDDRAALGLAGVAVKSGARSALASLWFINDKAASMLVIEFYKLLKESETMTKAEALQRAQTHLLSTEDYQHPAYWAPFLLIGSWL